ncbi:MAG TPA: hypothetical protein PLM07_07210 [Candidatus Rifleibacterium sp.]|nr:hypothetical protein [Candidatus Rifleibacterium sp.]
MKKISALALGVLMVIAFGGALRAEDAPVVAPAADATVIDATQATPAVTEEVAKPAAGEEKKALEVIEVSGVLEVKEADASKDEKHKTVLLTVGEVVYRLIPNKDTKDSFAKLEALGGKTVKVKGEVLPANPPKYPLAAIKVAEFSE